ncbi:hypothetical protein H6P81_009247 [Aristolochia fimbriata]|uniref:Polymerase nucleotidyl transferase domain-containing protein n=1 Tax=Aristolochia fimbriata TaxID=158543 RepID=A0AAV7ENG2_ARIFI|nr:hypothetical protein H6P81_009247 [Aristolochia fimbriata]
MGDHEGWAQPSGLLPNGLLPNEAAGVTRVLDAERWSKAEERTAELIACIQPNQPSEERRNAVADYVQRLIMKCFSCQVFTFGSVPLKTYLPDGDIDLTAFSKNQNLKDSWAQEVRDMLEKEEKSENAEFRVKEVQYIQAEVKIIKCLVENIVVDISFNQLGGLCTLCFLEEVDHLINQNHLFKRSIILIKAWCYYESRILGAHHGLISTYALETLVLYIFHVFNNSFAGPLEVLYRFLEFFSNFDWDNFCVSLWGPVPIGSLPDMTAEPPRRDSGELLLSKLFLDACSSVYAVFPGGQESQNQPFISKHFNVIDPLRTNNNLGRSVSKGNFFRIRSAFAFGAKRLARLLECPKDNLTAEVNQFFMNTWDRHGSGLRPDAPHPDLWPPRPLKSDSVDVHENFRNHIGVKKKTDGSAHESRPEVPGIIPVQTYSNTNHPVENMSRTVNTSTMVNRTQSQKIYSNHTSTRIIDQAMRNITSTETTQAEKGQKSYRSDYSTSEHEGQGRYHFARTRSSPELTDTFGEVSARGRRNRAQEAGKNQFVYANSRKKNIVHSEVGATSHSTRSSSDDPSSVRHSPSHQSLETAGEPPNALNNYHEDSSMSPVGAEELASVSETMEMHQEEQDLVNMIASSRLHNFGSQVQVPLNLASTHLPLPLSPSVLASMGYAPRNVAGMVPANIPLIEPSWGSNMQFPQGLVSSPVSHYFPTVSLTSNTEEVAESGNESSGLTDANQEDGDAYWHEQDGSSLRGLDPESGNFQGVQSDDKQRSMSVGSNFASARGAASNNSFMRGQNKFVKENRGGLLKEDHVDPFQYQNRGNDSYATDRSANMKSFALSQASSSKSKPSSESSWDGSSVKSSKSTRDKRGRKVQNPLAYGKVKSGWQHEGPSSDNMSSQADDDSRDWIPLSTMNSEMTERNTGSSSVVPQQLRGHQLPGYDPSQISGSESMIPIAPMLVGSGSRQRTMDGSGVLPFAFYPTGPPVPFFIMPHMYNFPTETGNSDGSTSHFDRDEELDGSVQLHQSDQNFDSSENLEQSEGFSNSISIKGAPVEPSEEQHKPDILNSDFTSHWQNLQYGRSCQNQRYHGPLIYQSPVVVPPVYLQGHFPWDGPGRPVSTNVNLFTQLMSYGPRLVPVAPLQPGSSRPPTSAYQRYGDEAPRYRGGTGTYLPNPKVSYRERHSLNSRNHRGHYNYDRTDHGEREGNWNTNSKSRASGRNHGRGQAEKPNSRSDRLTTDSRSERQWDLYRHDQSLYNSYQAQSGPLNPANTVHGSANMAYGMYQVPTMSSNGIPPSGPTVPSVVMLYSYDHNVGSYVPPTEQLEFGSLGPVQFSGVNDGSQLGDAGSARTVFESRHGTYQGGSPARSSPDQPSSPQLQRSAAQRNYQLKEEDFPPLSFQNQGGGNGGGNSSYDSKPSHYQTFLFNPPHS